MAISGGDAIRVANLGAEGCGNTTQIMFRMNGESGKATVISSWRIGVRGDSLAGTVERKPEGFELANLDLQPVRGSRAN